MRLVFIALLGMGVLFYLVFVPFFQKGYRQKINWLMVIVLSIVLVPTTYMEYKWQKIESFGTQIVQEFSANSQGNLKCQRFFNTIYDTQVATAGIVNYDEPNKAILKYEKCKDLEAYFINPLAPNFDQTIAFQVLLHEAAHVEGIRDEADAECKALVNHVDAASRYLGTMKNISTKNMEQYQLKVSPNMPRRYISDDNCASFK